MNLEERKLLAESHFGLIDLVLEELLSREYNKIYRTQQDDLYGVAALALVNASRKFDTTRGVQFRTYASNYMRAMLVTEFRRLYKHNKKLTALEEITEDLSYDPFEEEESYNNLIKLLEPEDEDEKRIYYEIIIGGGTRKELSEETGMEQRRISYLKKKMLETMKEKLELRG